jgi:hypothetical protein
MECERIGVPMSIEDARSLIAESSTSATIPAASATLLPVDETRSVKLEPLDPLQSDYARIRDRYLKSGVPIPNGATIYSEFNEDGSSRRRTGSYTSDVVKHETKKDVIDHDFEFTPPLNVPAPASASTSTSSSNGHDDLFNDFDLG